MKQISLIGLLLLSVSAFSQELEIDVVGLFKNAAMLTIQGKERLMKVGDQSEEGVLLVSADSQGAVIEVNGESMALDLSSRIASNFETPKETIVTILLNRSGQYKTRGAINGRSVELLVDTGANIVAMNSNTARQLGIQTNNGRAASVTTASGVTNSVLVTLDLVQVGNIKATNVSAVVMEGAYPVDILLGMTFLTNVEITESAGVMQLKGKF